MTERPPDIPCRVCSTPVAPVFLSFRPENPYLQRDVCRSCDEQEQKEVERRERLAAIEARIAGVNDVLISCGVSRRHVHAKLEDFVPSYRALHKRSRGLYVFGPPGTGKTYLMCAIMRAMILDPLQAALVDVTNYRPQLPLMVSTPDLLRSIRATFEGRGSESGAAIFERYSLCHTLMLDDLGAEKVTDWTRETLFALIDHRYRYMRKTYVTTNLSHTELVNQIGDRSTSRLVEMCRVVRLSGDDRRMRPEDL